MDILNERKVNEKPLYIGNVTGEISYVSIVHDLSGNEN